MLKVDELFCVYAFGIAVFVIMGLLLLRIHINVISFLWIYKQINYYWYTYIIINF